MNNIIHLAPIVWISKSVIGLFTMIINFVIFKKEWKKRKSKKINFTNKYLQIFSFITIIFGVLYGFCTFLLPFNIFCHFASPMNITCIICECLFMGYYQLSRLYYCFSSHKIYSNKGYPNWLFIIMYIFGILLSFTGILSTWLSENILRSCGINKKYQYFENKYTIFNKLFQDIWYVGPLIYILWDFTTLLLYIFKIRSFKKYKSSEY